MSMQQWIYRAKDLGIISASRATEWFKIFKIKRWYHKEPVDVAPEEPQRFKLLVIQAVTEGIISPVRAAEFLGIPYHQFRKDTIAGLEEAHS